MSAQKIKIPRMPDRTIISFFQKIGDLYNVPSIGINALGFANIGQVNLSAINEHEELQAIIEHDSSLINTCSIGLKAISISYHRGGQVGEDLKSPIYDEISINQSQQHANELSNTERLRIIALINSDLKAFEPGRIVQGTLTEEQNQLLSIHNSTLERLERLNEDLVRQSSNFRKKLEEEFYEKSKVLEEELKLKQNKLEESFQKKSETIEVKEKQLESRLAEIDDRDNTHVRREIRDRMLDDVKNRISNFGVSESTEKKRRPVLIGIIALSLALIILMILSIYELHVIGNDPNGSIRIYWLWGRFALFSFGLVGTILYYIKWQNWWAEYHSNSEFQLQQFYIDVNRANWVIESCLEWSKETDKPIPIELLNSISKNLFTSEKGELDKVTHPADELASALLGSASKLKLNLNGNQLEFDKPGNIPKTKQ